MFSRAHLLIERDHDRLIKENLWGIEVFPINENNYFEWIAKISGMKGTIWEGGVFRIYLKFDEHYNHRPPKVCFHTIPFHPNIDMITGQPCVDFLDDLEEWNESYSMGYILLTIQNLLSNPVLDEAVNTDAVNMITYSPHSYKQMVLNCVTASQRLEAGVHPHISDDKVRFGPPKDDTPKIPTPKTSNLRAAKVSFEDYLQTWSGIATSKGTNNMKNPLLEALRDQPSLQEAHYGLPVEELQQQVDRQMQEHKNLMYGNFKTKPSEKESKQAKVEQVNRMRKIYLQPRKTPPSSPGTWRRSAQSGHIEEPWEREVDDLVAWTAKLDQDNL